LNLKSYSLGVLALRCGRRCYRSLFSNFYDDSC